MRKMPLLSRCGAWGLLAVAALSGVARAEAAESGKADRSRLDEKLSRVEIPFVANTGVHDPAVAFSASTFEGAAFVTRKGQIVYSLVSLKAPPGWTLTETPVTSRALRPVANEPSETCVSYFLGDDPTQWRTNAETYRSVLVGTAWKGISLQLRAHGNSIEKLFTVEPGANVSRIRMRVGGAKSLRLDRAGNLIIATGLGQVRLTAPIAFQEIGGVRTAVAAAYRFKGARYGFVLGAYDRAFPVVIDPLLQATYLGGNSTDGALALALHPTSGEVFVAGYTLSTVFPGTSGGAQPAFAGTQDAFVARLNATLTTLNQATYLGGSGGGITGSDDASAVAIHPTSGEVFVAGSTSSGNFPGRLSGAQPSYAGGEDAFVARFSADLTTLHQSTYLGGSGLDHGLDLAIHPTSGEVFVSGETTSTNFPNTPFGAQPTAGGSRDGFVARLNAALTTLSQATYLGGTGLEVCPAMAIHPASGEIYLAGDTSSAIFPGTTGGAQPAMAGGGDAFVARLNSTLTTLHQSTYLGGSVGFGEMLYALAIHPTSGEVFIAGQTRSTDFPKTAGGAQTACVGDVDCVDAFVARLSASLTAHSQSTYLGGEAADRAIALAIHPTSGDVYVAGDTGSTDFPGTTGGAQPTHGGFIDAFVARLNATLMTLSKSTYLGGSERDLPWALAIHPTSGEVFVAGYTFSTVFPGTSGGAQPGIASQIDGYVARLSADLAGGGEPGLSTYTETPCRVLDTRDPSGPFGGPALAAGATRNFIITGRCNIPAGARGVIANVTATAATGPGHLSIFPAGTGLPLVSTINFKAGEDRANNAILVLGNNGGISVFDGQSAGNTVHFILDVSGYTAVPVP